MKECSIKLTLGDGSSLEFNSNRKLDEYLWTNQNTLLDRSAEGEVFYAIDKKTQVRDTLETVVKAGKAFIAAASSGVVKNVVELGDVAVGIGLENLYGKLGNPRSMSDPASQMPEGLLTDDQLNFRKDLGTDQHAIIEAKLGGLKPTFKVLQNNSGIRQKAELAADKVIDMLIKKHTVNGVAPKFITEATIVSRDIDPNFLDLIRNSDLTPSWKVASTEEIRQAWGRADIVVMDNNGRVIVYDVKTTTSTIEVGSSKNIKNELKLASYVAMLRQWGVPAVSGGFIEIGTTLSPDGLSVIDMEYHGVKPFSRGSTMSAALTYYPSNVEAEIESLETQDDIMSRLVPNNTFMNQRKLLQLEVEVEKNKTIPIQDSDTIHKYKPNAKYKYFIPPTRKPKGLNSSWMYGSWLIGNTKEELASRIEEYVALANEMDSDVLPLYADAIENAIVTGDTIALESELRSLNVHSYKQVLTQLRHYIKNRWKLINNPALIQNGIFLFQKPNSALIEVVMLDTHALHLPLSFSSNPNDPNQKDPARTTILGQFLRDKDIDPMFFLDGTVGSAVLMKAMIYFNQNPEILNGNRIVSIKAISVTDNHIKTASNAELNQTYGRFALEYKKKYSDQLKWSKDLLMDDISASVIQCHEILADSDDEAIRNLMNYKAFKEIHPDGIYKIDELRQRLLQIQKQDPSMDSARISAQNELQMAKRALQRGYLVYHNIFPKSEKDVGGYTDGRLALEGTKASSMKESKSVIMRQLQQIISNFHDIYKQEFEKLAATWQHKYAAFKAEAGISPIVADDFKYFREHWFVKDGNEIHKSMRLIDENNSYWNGKPAEKALYDLYLSFWDRLRYNNNENAIELAKEDGSYYEIPLVRTNFRKQLEAGNLWSAAKGWFTRFKQKSAGLFFDLQEESDIIEESKEERLEGIKLPSYIQDFVGDSRMKAIEKYGTSAYETNMDIVALTVLAVGLRHEMSDHAMMMENALRANTYYESVIGANSMKQILDTFDKQINSKMFLRSVIERENRGIATLINFFKGITSTGTLAFSWKSFVRESIRGITDAFSRTAFDEMYGNKFSAKDFMDGLEVVLESAPSNIKVNSFVMQLSHYFGMANFSANQIVEASNSNPYGFYELGGDVMFITATWPDFIHRTSMLIAHLKHIGAYDAYSLDENEVLQYDMTKDKRFQTWLKYKDDPTKVPVAEVDKFVQERDLYRQLLKDFEDAGRYKDPKTKTPYVEGDLLPDALSPRTQDNIKTTADRLYGNYDDETKSLIQKELLGSLFFQFKTYPLERLSHWFKSATHTNDIEMIQQYWDDGEPVICYIDDEDHVIHGRKSDVSDEWLMNGRAWYLKYPNGHLVQGHIQRMFAVLGYVLNHNQAELENTWATDPYFRGQLVLGLYDTLFGVLLAFLIRMLFGEETISNMKNEEWYTRWLYAVGTGMTQDGPVWSLMSNIVGNGAPPSLSILRQYMTNAASVITGDTSVVYGFANSLGATREFANILRDQ